MSKLSEYCNRLNHKYFAWEPAANILGIQSGIVVGCISIYYVLAGASDAYIIAMIGGFLCALMQTVGLKTRLSRRIKYSLVLTIAGGAMTMLGAYAGNDWLLNALLISLLIPLVALTSGSDHMVATLVLFTIDMFIVNTGIQAPTVYDAFIAGISFACGSLSLIVVSSVTTPLFNLPAPLSIVPAPLSLKRIFHNYHKNIRFAVLLTIAVEIANGIALGFNLPQGYWIPMTAMLILKSDYDNSKSRISHRLYGTLFGTALAASLAILISSKLILATLMLPILYFIVISLARHYGSYTAFLTIMVTVMLNLITPNGYIIAEHRLIDTLCGIISVVIVLWIIHPLIIRKVFRL